MAGPFERGNERSVSKNREILSFSCGPVGSTITAAWS
jgi:hypothetical protein